MIGNQLMINSQILSHEKNPITSAIGIKKELDIIYTITDEYWKEWRRQLTNGETPVVTAYGLGNFELMYGKSKSYLRHLLARLKNIRRKYADSYLIEGTRAYGMYNNTIKKFRSTWKQVDCIKIQVNKNLAEWKIKKALKQQNNICQDLQSI
jgi:hypothetical protein